MFDHMNIEMESSCYVHQTSWQDNMELLTEPRENIQFNYTHKTYSPIYSYIQFDIIYWPLDITYEFRANIYSRLKVQPTKIVCSKEDKNMIIIIITIIDINLNMMLNIYVDECVQFLCQCDNDSIFLFSNDLILLN